MLENVGVLRSTSCSCVLSETMCADSGLGGADCRQLRAAAAGDQDTGKGVQRQLAPTGQCSGSGGKQVSHLSTTLALPGKGRQAGTFHWDRFLPTTIFHTKQLLPRPDLF